MAGPMLSEEDGRILCREGRLPLALRVFMVVLGLGCGGMIPAVFLHHAHGGMSVPVLLLVAGIVVFCGSVGAVFLLAAFVRPMELVLDPASGLALRVLRGDLSRRRDAFPLADLPPPQVVMRDSEDGAYPVLRLRLPRGRAFEATEFRDRAEAEVWRDRIAALITAAQ